MKEYKNYGQKAIFSDRIWNVKSPSYELRMHSNACKASDNMSDYFWKNNFTPKNITLQPDLICQKKS
jgi:hypothetical protein